MVVTYTWITHPHTPSDVEVVDPGLLVIAHGKLGSMYTIASAV